MEHGWLDALASLDELVAGTHEERAASADLWAMTPEQRVGAMWGGRLSLLQLTEWSRRTPREVPLLNGEFAYIVIRTPEWLDAPGQPGCQQTGVGVRECRCGADHAAASRASFGATSPEPVR
jgi:hypothetical protein